MNQSKFSLADLLTVLGAIIFGFFCFLSFNFISLGETVLSVVWASVLAIILGGLALIAKLLKRTSRNFKSCIIWEWVVLFLFVCMAFIATLPFSHNFTVYENKSDIQQKVVRNITQAEGLFTDYEKYASNRLKIYKSRLNSVSSAKNVNPNEYREYGFVDGTDDDTQIKNKIFSLKAQLYPSNYLDIKTADSAWLASSKSTIENWKPIGIVTVINELEKNITDWNSQLKQFSSFRAKGEVANDFEVSLTFTDVINQFSELDSPTIFSLVTALFLYVLMLFSYYITRRDSRYPGLKVIFGTVSKEDNEW